LGAGGRVLGGLVAGSRVAESSLVVGSRGGWTVVGVGRRADLVVGGLGTGLVVAGPLVRVEGDGVGEVSRAGALVMAGDGGGRC